MIDRPRPMPRRTIVFGALVLAQAAHSIEESVGRLWEVFAPARFVAGLISTDLERGFIAGNVAIFVFGLWCFFAPVRRGWAIGVPLMWLWAAVEVANGVVHLLLSLYVGGYAPGVATAPFLLLLGGYLARLLARAARSPPGSP